MSPLEQRYRRLLTWLPEPARSRWADDMTETWLEATTADDPEYAEFGSPSLADRLDVARLALRLRLGAPGASVRAVATGRTVRLVAVAGTVALASMALMGLVTTAWLHGVLPLVDAPDLGPVRWGPWDAVGAVSSGLTVALGVCALRGLAATRPLALAVLVALLVEVAMGVGGPGLLMSLPTQLTVAVPLVAAVLAPTGPPVRRPWWPVWLGLLVVAPWAVGALLLTLFPADPPGGLLPLSDPFVQLGIALVATAGVLLVRRRPERGAAELATAVLGVALLPALVSRLPYDTPAGYTPTVLAATLGVLLSAAATGAVGMRALRTLPADVPA
ncbi:hypothetical protein [Modestobacter italicus]|uniref:hypothetical protein n=1 Tax=Modestobacter italicus (strain DSM 44449 / CECT 9708 / BC 501) TaxID=2732864 RepID=UPI001C978FB0|nr:hypothetical protein [Modestobacter italicus]